MTDLVGRVAAQPKTVYRGRRVKKLPPAEVLELTDDRWTPRALFEGLGIPFDLDVAASERNAKVPNFYTRFDDGLSLPWVVFKNGGNTCFCRCHKTPAACVDESFPRASSTETQNGDPGSPLVARSAIAPEPATDRLDDAQTRLSLSACAQKSGVTPGLSAAAIVSDAHRSSTTTSDETELTRSRSSGVRKRGHSASSDGSIDAPTADATESSSKTISSRSRPQTAQEPSPGTSSRRAAPAIDERAHETLVASSARALTLSCSRCSRCVPHPATVFCNPPYSNIGAWVEKGHLEMSRGCKRITYLLPANRTDQEWWHEFVEPWRDQELGIRTKFIKGRIRFECETGVVKSQAGSRGGKKNTGGAQPPFASVFIHFTQPWRVPLVVTQGELFGGAP